MALTILHAPNELSPVGNPIAYKVQTDNENINFIVMKLLVESEYGALDFAEIIQKESPPDSNKVSEFYIQENLKACLSPEMPDFTAATMTASKTLCKRYKVAFAELTEADRPEDVVFVAQEVRFAVLAEIPFEEYPYNQQLTANNILSAKELNRRLSYNQLEYISILSPSNEYEVTASISVLYKDESVQNFSQNFGELQKYQIGFVPIGVYQRNYPNPLDIAKITITIAGTQLVYSLYETSDFYENVEFYYINQNAGIDSLFCEGDSEENVEIDKIEEEHYIPYNYDSKDSKYNHVAINARKSGSANTGYMPASEHKAASQLFISPLIFMRKNGKIVKVLASKKQVLLDKASERLKSYVIDYQYAF